MVAGGVLLAHHGDMVVSAVHGRAHQVHRAGVHADILLVGVLFMDRLRHQAAVGAHHEAAKLRVNRHIAHACRNQHLLVNPAHALSDDPDVVGLLIRTVGNSDAAGKIDETDIRPRLFFQPDSQLKEHLCKHRIILVRHRIAGQERVKAEMLRSLFPQNPVGVKKLLLRHAVLGVPGVVHDIVADLEDSARVEPAADGLRNIAYGLLQKINVRKIIQIDDSADLRRVRKLLRRRVIGGKHDILPGDADLMGQHQLRHGRAVTAAAILPQDINQKRIRRSLHREIFFIPRIPGKRLLQRLRVLTDSLLVIEIKGRRIGLRNLLQLLQGYKWFLIHRFSLLVFILSLTIITTFFIICITNNFDYNNSIL